MNSTDSDEAETDVFSRRLRPQLILLDADFAVAVAEWDTGRDAFRALGLQGRNAKRMLPEIENKLRAAVDAMRNEGEPSVTIEVGDKTIVRVTVLEGNDAHRYALFVEPSRRREDLHGAIERFRLTPRQAQVLALVLEGLSAKDIAAKLSIAETTVGDYFKQLLDRTNSRNRADMVARVLNWSGPRKKNSPLSGGRPENLTTVP
jgi:DNA-binding NarL/FixJ family response regulator